MNFELEQLQGVSELVQDVGLACVAVLIILYITYKLVNFILNSIKIYSDFERHKSGKILDALIKVLEYLMNNKNKGNDK